MYSQHVVLHNVMEHAVIKKKLAPSRILREAKIAYYARNMFEAGRFVVTP